MDVFEALVLGVIQGLAEWLPISSSGHLVIAQEIMGLSTGENLLFDLFLHLGTMLAVIVFFRKELGRVVLAMLTTKARRGPQEEALRMLGLMILVATIPVAALGVLLSSTMEDVFTVTLVGAALLVNAAILVLAERRGLKGTRKSANLPDAVTVGLFQAVSILPGISRSGATISGGLFRGLERETAATFSFLLSVPTLVGAFSYGIVTLEKYDTDWLMVVIGTATAFVTGLVSIEYLLKAVRSGRLWVFAAYCAVLGSLVLVLTL
jgi:undecaprenyl-diphosphatase